MILLIFSNIFSWHFLSSSVYNFESGFGFYFSVCVGGRGHVKSILDSLALPYSPQLYFRRFHVWNKVLSVSKDTGKIQTCMNPVVMEFTRHIYQSFPFLNTRSPTSNSSYSLVPSFFPSWHYVLEIILYPLLILFHIVYYVLVLLYHRIISLYQWTFKVFSIFCCCKQYHNKQPYTYIISHLWKQSPRTDSWEQGLAEILKLASTDIYQAAFRQQPRGVPISPAPWNRLFILLWRPLGGLGKSHSRWN